MRSLQEWLDEYSESHQNKTNKKIHFVAVPVIYFTVVGLLYSIPSLAMLGEQWWNNWAILIMIPVMAFYLSLSVSLAIGMTVFTFACFYLVDIYAKVGPTSVLTMSITLFVAAWILQFYGHKVEGKKPSFVKDLAFLLIGPAWVINWAQKSLFSGK